MSFKSFVLGLFTGVVLTILAAAVIAVLVLSSPAPEAPEPPSPLAGDVVVSVSEDYLSTLATSFARAEGPIIQSVAVDVRPQRQVDMILTAQVTVLGRGIDVQAKVISLAQVRAGRLELSVQKVSLIRVEIPLDVLPESLRAAIESMESDVNETVNSILPREGLAPVAVSSDDSSITVALRVQ